MGFARLRRGYLRGPWRARGGAGEPRSLGSSVDDGPFREGGIERRPSAREQIGEACRASGTAETRQQGGRGDSAAASPARPSHRFPRPRLSRGPFLMAPARAALGVKGNRSRAQVSTPSRVSGRPLGFAGAAAAA